MDPDEAFPCSLTIQIPFPTPRLAQIAYQTLAVDAELSTLVTREFTLLAPSPPSSTPAAAAAAAAAAPTILQTHYKATTNRMLRVSVNGFFDALGTVLQVMEELDVDVVHARGLGEEEGLHGVQGVEVGLTGEAGVVR